MTVTTSGKSDEISNEASALSEIVSWSVDAPDWQRDALRRLCQREKLDDADSADLLAICKGTKAASPVTADHIRDPGAAAAEVSLTKLHNLRNVNALQPGETLSFQKSGLTVIYGDNGAGKSGYARVLKQACRARLLRGDVVLPNINAASLGVPQAELGFTIGGQNRSFVWQQGAATDPILTAVSVFDSRTATVHVDATNELAYTPVPLKILAYLADSCGLLKGKLTAEIKTLQDQTPAMLREVKVGPQTAVGKLLAALSAKTKVEAVEALAGLTPEQSAEMKQLDSDLASDPVRAARSLQTLRTKIEEGSTSLANLVATASDQNIQNMLGLKGEFEAARSAAALASADLFSGEPLPNVGTPVWRTLWDAARRYSEEAAYAGRDFPVVGHDARCVLCHQELDTEASSRLGRFETFIQDESKKREEAARAAYAAVVDELVAARFSMISLRKLVSVILDDLEDEALANAVRLCGLTNNWRLRAAMKLSADASLLDLPRGMEFDFGLLAAHVEALAKRAAALVTEKSSPERLAMVSRRDELAAREWLATVKADVIAQIGRLVAIDGLNKAAKATATNKITALSTQLAGSLVTHRLRARFAQEVDKFGVAGLAVELQQARSSAGIPYFHVRLISKPDKPVGEILSEGEHRCVALAAFMAELATTEATSSIVFDDPVSSLDHIHRDKVAARLAMESLKRQVIIFTHDIAFLVLLEEVCRATRERAAIPMAYRVVSRGADMAGFCNTEPPANVLPVEKVIPQMRKHLNNVKIHHERGDQASWRREVGSFEKELRESWERAVEEAVSPVIKRLSQKVYTDGLIKLTVLNETDCTAMREAFGRCSRLIHSQPGELNPKLPTPTEIEGEISALESWITGVKVRQDAAK
jgi:energy-coupling factor transporter ATP-binding protein EcfA2